MHPKLDQKLCSDFPLLYGDRDGDMQSTCMSWGFETGDGWYHIIYELSAKLEPLIKKWIEEAEKDPNPDVDFKDEDGRIRWFPRASQVKEKYGTLRFYMTSCTDEMYVLIQDAERKSAETCETCGKPGKCRGGGWISCCCDECAEKRYPEIATGDDEVPLP